MAAQPPLIALKDARLGFGGKPLFEGLDLALSRGERAALVGRNGSGKSTLLKVLAGSVELDRGSRSLQAGTGVGYLPQAPLLPADQTVLDYVADGLSQDDPARRASAESSLDRLSLDGAAKLGTLSGGEGRRAALARALVIDPELLLLDEPTNHLDLPTIAWLEGELARFRGALLLISHDRTFLAKVSNRTLWLDRGKTHRLDKSFAAFEAWAEEIRAAEARDLERLGKSIEREEHWLHRGVTARRKRNMGRLARLKDLRANRASLLRSQPGQVEMTAAQAGSSGKLVIEAEHLSKAYEQPDGRHRPVLRDFSTRVLRGDRIGVVGRNGAGKTTLINLLLGRLQPDSGSLRLGTNLEIAVFDQRRESLDPDATLWKTLAPDGGDSVMVGDRQRHVVAYLRDFLFEESQVKQPVKALSGGEANRLLLARLLARPSNLLVLDEPTNDLDMDTLDLLEEVLGDYQGTLILVSHDRDFLDRLCTSVILMDGAGGAEEYPGGFSDAVRQAGGLPDARRVGSDGPQSSARSAKSKPSAKPKSGSSGKLSYREQRELDGLPDAIAKLEAEIDRLQATLADPALYSRDPDGFGKATDALAAATQALAATEERWLELEQKREELAAGTA
ncbi:ATP-binding cassette domain-containing protein [Algihabitans sp.]|uniref:ATP-binding cassette domain-containing protein n=1 Tax=Algihabitans sp. TaxID=2821514 RepID=UPI003BABF788